MITEYSRFLDGEGLEVANHCTDEQDELSLARTKRDSYINYLELLPEIEGIAKNTSTMYNVFMNDTFI